MFYRSELLFCFAAASLHSVRQLYETGFREEAEMYKQQLREFNNECKQYLNVSAGVNEDARPALSPRRQRNGGAGGC